MDTKILGYLLLSLGFLLALLSLISVFMVFTGRSKPFPIFSQSSVSVDLGSLLANQLPQGTTKNEPSPIEFLSAKTINDMFNLGAHLILMSFISGLGVKIASLGVQLIRPIEIKFNQKEV